MDGAGGGVARGGPARRPGYGFPSVWLTSNTAT
jgi:hypothetical protein